MGSHNLATHTPLSGTMLAIKKGSSTKIQHTLKCTNHISMSNRSFMTRHTKFFQISPQNFVQPPSALSLSLPFFFLNFISSSLHPHFFIPLLHLYPNLLSFSSNLRFEVGFLSFVGFQGYVIYQGFFEFCWILGLCDLLGFLYFSSI